MFEIKDLFELTVDGAFSSFEEFQDFANQVDNATLFSIIKPGAFKDLQEFESSLVEKKNQVITPSGVVEDVTESTTETEITPGSLDSSVEEIDESEEQPYEYLQDAFQELDAIEPESPTFESANSIRARLMNRSQREVNTDLKEKILSDYNIQKALENEIITESEIDNAIKGSKGSIKKLQQLSVKTPEEYRAEIDKGDLNNPYAYKNKSDLVEFVSNPEDELKKLEAIQATQSFDAETKKLLDANPDATEEELDAIFNREGAPTEEQYELAEDDFVPTGFEGSEMSNMYNVQALKKVEGFDIKDFDGYLNEQGYKQEYLRLLKDETISEDGRSFDYSGQYNPALAAERLKLQYLTNYINKQVERNVESQVLNYQLKNKGRHPSFDGIQFSFSSGVDDKQLSKFIEEELPIITSKLKERDVANEELYQDMKNGEVKGVGQGFKQGYRSLEDRINSFSAGTYDFIGMDSVADEIRMSQAETELEREDFMRYTYASGKEKDIDGTTYLVDDKGQVYDKELGIRVTNVLTPNELKYIQKEVQTKGVNGTSFSTAGMIIQGTGIVTDMMFQIALTRGVGNIGKGGAAFLGAFDRGTKAVNFMSKIPMKATTASAMVAQGTLFSTNLAEQSYKQALDGGMSIAQAEEIQSIAGSQGLALGVLTAPISTQTYAMDKIFGKNANNVLIQGALKAYEKAGAKGAKAYWTKAALKAKRYFIESGKEVVQENVQQVGQAYVIGENVNEFAKKEIMANTISGDEFINTTILSAAAGFFMPFAGNISSNIKTNYNKRFRPGVAAIDKMNALYQLSKDVDKTEQLLNSQVTKRIYTEEQVKRILSDIEVYRETINKIPKGLGTETSLRVMSVISEINKLKSERDGLDADVFIDRVQEIDEDIAFLKNEIIQITRSGAKKVVAKKRPVASPDVEEEVVEEEVVEEEVVEEEVFDLSDLESDIKKSDKEGTLLDNLEKKTYSNGKEGMIRVDKENQNTLVFETNDEIIELGRKDEIGENTLASVDITLMPPEGVDVAPVGTVKGDKPLDVFTIDGVDYTITGRRRDKKGKAVVKVKEVESGLNRRLVGEKAERILKDEALRREKKPQEIKLTVEGKETVKPVVKKKSKKEAQEEYDKKTLAEIEAMEKQSEEDVTAFEEMVIEEAASKSSDRDVVQVGDNIFQVTKKKDGSFAVSQMRDDGKLIPVKDESSRKRPIGVFKSKKSNEERKAINEAERLINEFKSQEQDKILDFLDKAISATSSNGRAFDATLGIPMFAANNSLKIVRASYKAGKTILQAIQDALESLRSQGYNPNEYTYKQYVFNQLNNKKDAIQKPSTKKQVLPDDAGSQEEGGDTQMGLQQVGEGDTQQVTTDTQVEEGDPQTDTTSDKTTQTDTKKVNLLRTIKEGQKLPTKPKQTKNKNGSITSGKVHLYHSTNGVENLNNILENGIDFEKQKAVDGLFFAKLGSPYRQDDSFVVIETDIENIPFNQRTEGQEVALGQISDYKIVHSSRMSPRELKTLSSLEMILNRETNGGVEGYEKSLQNYKKRNKNSELVKYLESQPASVEQDMSVKKSPSVNKILGKKRTKVTVDEYSALKTQIKLEARAAREAQLDLKKKRKAVNSIIKLFSDKRKGVISPQKLQAVLNKSEKTNFYSEKSVDEFLNYMEKVFNDAEHIVKEKNAINIQGKIKNAINKKTNNDLRLSALAFLNINPRMVQDIDAYLFNANNILNGLKPTKVSKKGGKVSLKQSSPFNIQEVESYTSKENDLQKQRDLDRAREYFEKVTGLDSSNMTLEQMQELYTETKEKEVDNIEIEKRKKEINNALSQAFADAKNNLTASNKSDLNKLLNLDLDSLNTKTKMQLLDILINFNVNGTLSGARSVIAKAKGAQNTESLVKRGIKSVESSNYLGRGRNKNLTTLNLVFNLMFKGEKKAGMVMDAIGLTPIINGSSDATKKVEVFVKKYADKFKNKKTKKGKYLDTYNSVERQTLAELRRVEVNSDFSEQKQFENTKSLLKESYETLLDSDKKIEKDLGKIYKEAYDKIVKNSSNISEVESKADPVNLEGVKYFTEEWAKYYDAISDTQTSIYNSKLGQDINYTPRGYTVIDADYSEKASDDVDLEKPLFTIPSRTNPYDKKSSVLFEANRTGKLPPGRVLNLSFETNNINRLKAALIDINTAEGIRQVQGAFDSPSFNKLFPNRDSRNMIKKRIAKYIDLKRGNRSTTESEQKALRQINRIAAAGVARSLGGPTQAVKQMVPFVNTVTNAGLIPTTQAAKVMLTKKGNKIINESGMPIANRGIQSQGDIDSLNSLIEKQARTLLGKGFDKIDELNKAYLDIFLVKSDVMTARTSFLAYYIQDMARKGVSYSDIDWTKPLNKDSMNTAQRKVDRQQNTSDPDLQGDLFTNQDIKSQFVRKSLFPFANFLINQKNRSYADVSTLFFNPAALKGEKTTALRSIAGLGVETATFGALGYVISNFLASTIASLMGGIEDEEEEKKRKGYQITGRVGGAIADIMVPLPVLNDVALGLLNDVMGMFQDGEKEGDVFKFFAKDQKTFLEQLGVLGIIGGKAMKAYEMVQLARTGVAENEYIGKKSTAKISEDARERMGTVAMIYILNQLGVGTSEMNYMSERALKLAKKTRPPKPVRVDAPKKSKKKKKSSGFNKPSSNFSSKKKKSFNVSRFGN